MHMYIYIYIYTYTYWHIYIYTHTYWRTRTHIRLRRAASPPAVWRIFGGFPWAKHPLLAAARPTEAQGRNRLGSVRFCMCSVSVRFGMRSASGFIAPKGEPRRDATRSNTWHNAANLGCTGSKNACCISLAEIGGLPRRILQFWLTDAIGQKWRFRLGNPPNLAKPMQHAFLVPVRPRLAASWAGLFAMARSSDRSRAPVPHPSDRLKLHLEL